MSRINCHKRSLSILTTDPTLIETQSSPNRGEVEETAPLAHIFAIEIIDRRLDGTITMIVGDGQMNTVDLHLVSVDEIDLHLITVDLQIENLDDIDNFIIVD